MALINKLADWLFDERKEQRATAIAGRALAFRLVALLTVYSRKCSDCIGESRTELDDHGVYVAEVPDFPELPDDASGWTALPPRLAARVRDLPIAVDHAQSGVFWTDAYEGPPEAAEEARYECADLGLEAWETAESLRRQYHFGRFRRSTYFVTFLKGERRKRTTFLARWRSSLRKVLRKVRVVRQRWLKRSN